MLRRTVDPTARPPNSLICIGTIYIFYFNNYINIIINK
jgi:hypothetical protein